jgi:sensor histidine kinase YesM
MLAQLITYMRATLQTSRAAETSLAQEFTLIKAYLELLAIRMGKRLQYQTNLPESLAQARIAPMLLQPLVENAIKHGLEPAISGGTLIVGASEEQQQLVIRIADTGLGLPDQPEAIPGRTHSEIMSAMPICASVCKPYTAIAPAFIYMPTSQRGRSQNCAYR